MAGTQQLAQAAQPSALSARWLRAVELAAPLTLLAAIAAQIDDDARNYWAWQFSGKASGSLINPWVSSFWQVPTVLAWMVLVPLMRPLTATNRTPRPAQSRFLVCMLLAGSWAWLVIFVHTWHGTGLEVQHWLPLALLVWAIYARLGWAAPRTVGGADETRTCPACGYSLTGLRADAKCPECGGDPGTTTV